MIIDILVVFLIMGPGLLGCYIDMRKINRFRNRFLYVGAYLALTYLVYRYFGDKYTQFSFFHLYIFSFAFIMPIWLFYLTRKSPIAIKWFNLILSLLLFLVVMSRFITWPLILHSSIISALPLHICNLMSIILFPAVLFNNQPLKNVGTIIGFAGGIVTLYFAFNEGLGTFWEIRNIDSYIMHMLLTACPLYILLTRQIDFKLQSIIKSFYYLVPLYILMIVLNPLLGTSFLFTIPTHPAALVIYNWFPVTVVGIYQLNFIYFIFCMVGFMVGSILMFYLFRAGSDFLHKKGLI